MDEEGGLREGMADLIFMMIGTDKQNINNEDIE